MANEFKLYRQSFLTWSEVDVLGVTDGRVFAAMPDEWAIYKLDRKELEANGFAKTHWDSWELFAEAGMEREARTITAALANPTPKEFYVWTTTDDKWERLRVRNWTPRWIFVDDKVTSFEYPELGKIAWIDRKRFRKEDYDASPHGNMYTEAGMVREKREDAEREAKRGKGKAHQEWWTGAASQRREDAAFLGISENANEAEIMKAFRRLAKIHHPDTGGTGAAFQRVSDAKDRLLNRRKAHA